MPLSIMEFITITVVSQSHIIPIAFSLVLYREVGTAVVYVIIALCSVYENLY